jgi:hypothetical protein
MPTTSGILRATAEPKVKPEADDALWLTKCVGQTTTEAASVAWPHGGVALNTKGQFAADEGPRLGEEQKTCTHFEDFGF